MNIKKYCKRFFLLNRIDGVLIISKYNYSILKIWLIWLLQIKFKSVKISTDSFPKTTTNFNLNYKVKLLPRFRKISLPERVSTAWKHCLLNLKIKSAERTAHQKHTFPSSKESVSLCGNFHQTSLIRHPERTDASVVLSSDRNRFANRVLCKLDCINFQISSASSQWRCIVQLYI